jgi:hypothetical protein
MNKFYRVFLASKFGISFVRNIILRKKGEVNMDLYNTLDKAIAVLKSEYDRLKGDDGKISLADAWALFQTGIAELVKVAELLDVTGPEKKVMVLDALEKLYDEVIAPIDLKPVPNIIEPMVDKVLKQLFLTLANGAIDSMVLLLFKTK